MNSFKKIATVLAAALTLGVMSALPTQATVYADVVTIDAVADTINPGETATAVVSVSFLGTSTGDTLSVISAVLSAPSTASVPQFAVTETSSATVALSVDTKTAAVSPATNTTGYVTAKLTSSFYVPSVAGTYVVRFIPTLTSASGSVTSAAITWTVTVTAPDLKASTAYTTSILNAGETISATTDATVYASKTVSSDAAAVIVLTQKNAANGSASESITATVSGAGMLGHGTNHATISALGRSLVVPAGSYIGVFSDGTSGVGAITFTSASGAILATEKVTFYGDIVKVVTTVKKPTIAVGSNASAISAVAYDAAGVVVGAGTLTATSADLTVISNSATTASISNGEALFSLAGVKTGSAGVVVKSGTISADTVTVRVEAAVASIKLAFDKANYVAGEQATITLSPVDATGSVLSGKTYANLLASTGITTSYSFGGSSDTITATSITTDADGVKTYKVYMPLSAGAVTISTTGGTDLPAAGQIKVSASATVTDSASQALAAVAALAVTIAQLKTLITTLTNLVLKIQKKVKA
jgi:trimeric autotransporter adhesin